MTVATEDAVGGEAFSFTVRLVIFGARLVFFVLWWFVEFTICLQNFQPWIPTYLGDVSGFCQPWISTGIWFVIFGILLIILKDKVSKTPYLRSDYIRKCSLEKNITVIPGIRDLIIEFKRIGNNLDKITRSAGSDTTATVDDNLNSIKDDLRTVWAKLAVVMKKL